MNTQPRKVVIQKNPMSGSGLREPQLQRLTQRLEELGYAPCVYGNREMMAEDLKQESFRAQTRCLVAAGGDGTVDDLINRFPGIPLTILAMGTENLLAKQYEIPRNGALVAEMIAAGHTRNIDLGLAGQKRFAVMASCGFDATVVKKAHEARQGRITKLHYIRPILETIFHRKRIELVATSPDLPKPFSCELAVVSNVSRYASNLPVNPDAIDNDGLLDICLFRNITALRLIRHSLQGFLSGEITSTNIHRFSSQMVKLTSSSAVPIQADGDPIAETPLEFRVLPKALELIVPEQAANSKLVQIYVQNFAAE
ncbi:diacylglycerol/lipid kinase family protein [Rubinisphaera italica]|nr:diacylglycerol kinase family protein [Rubinisphaera italica]